MSSDGSKTATLESLVLVHQLRGGPAVHLQQSQEMSLRLERLAQDGEAPFGAGLSGVDHSRLLRLVPTSLQFRGVRGKSEWRALFVPKYALIASQRF